MANKFQTRYCVDSNFIQEAINAKEYTLKKTAERMGYSPRHFRRCLKDGKMTAHMIFRVSSVLKISVLDFTLNLQLL